MFPVVELLFLCNVTEEQVERTAIGIEPANNVVLRRYDDRGWVP